MGPTELKEVTLPSASICGPLEVEQVEVKATLTLVGPLTAKGLKAHSLEVTGPVKGESIEVDSLFLTGPLKVRELTVHQLLRVTGPVEIIKGKIKRLEVTSERVELEDVEINELIVLAQNKGKKCHLTLKGSSQVHQLIRFDKKEGLLEVIGDKVQLPPTIEGCSDPILLTPP